MKATTTPAVIRRPSNFYFFLKVVGIILLVIFSGLMLSILLRGSAPCRRYGFKLHQGSLDENTNRVLLGEYHPSHEASDACVNEITDNQRAHVVLVETAPEGKIVACEEHGITPKEGRQCQGWNSKQGLDRTFNLRDNFESAYYLTFVQDIMFRLETQTPEEIDNFCRENLQAARETYDGAIKKINPAEYTKHKRKDYSYSESDFFDSKYHIKIFEEILKLRGRGLSYLEINRLKYDTLLKGKEAISEYLAGRAKGTLAANKAMIDAFNKQSLFAVAVMGKSHAVVEKNNSNKEAVEYVERELRKGEQQNPYAILSM